MAASLKIMQEQQCSCSSTTHMWLYPDLTKVNPDCFWVYVNVGSCGGT